MNDPQEQQATEKLSCSYDYRNQAWIADGRYVRCGHPESMHCACHGKLHEGEKAFKMSKEIIMLIIVLISLAGLLFAYVFNAFSKNDWWTIGIIQLIAWAMLWSAL